MTSPKKRDEWVEFLAAATPAELEEFQKQVSVAIELRESLTALAGYLEEAGWTGSAAELGIMNLGDLIRVCSAHELAVTFARKTTKRKGAENRG